MNRKFVSIVLISQGLLIAILGGCQQAPPPFSAPPMTLHVDHFVGTPLSGPTAGPIPVLQPAQTMIVTATFTALEHSPKPVFESLGARARLISSAAAGKPMLATSQLGEEVQLLQIANAQDAISKLNSAGCGQTAPIKSLSGVVGPGITADFRVFEPVIITDSSTGESSLRQVGIQLSQSADKGPMELAIALQDFAAASQTSIGNVLDSEQAIVDLTAATTDGLCLVIPFHFDGTTTGAIAIELGLKPIGSDSDSQQILKNSQENLSQSIEAVAKRPGLSAGSADEWSSLVAAAASLQIPASRRVAMVYLADRTDASLCLDLAMIADDDLLAQLAQSIQTGLSQDSEHQTSQAVGWVMNRSALEILSQLLEAGESANPKEKLTEEENACLTTYAGEAGRHSSSMEGILRGVASQADLDNRLLAENMIYLEDSSPASRVRAFDWLKARGNAPTGYDPLGSAKDRRNALESNLAAEAKP